MCVYICMYIFGDKKIKIQKLPSNDGKSAYQQLPEQK